MSLQGSDFARVIFRKPHYGSLEISLSTPAIGLKSPPVSAADMAAILSRPTIPAETGRCLFEAQKQANSVLNRRRGPGSIPEFPSKMRDLDMRLRGIP